MNGIRDRLFVSSN